MPTAATSVAASSTPMVPRGGSRSGLVELLTAVRPPWRRTSHRLPTRFHAAGGWPAAERRLASRSDALLGSPPRSDALRRGPLESSEEAASREDEPPRQDDV